MATTNQFDSKFDGIKRSLQRRIVVLLSPTFAIDSTGIKTITTAHGLAYMPTKGECQVSVIEETAVDDWSFDLLKVVSVDTTNVVAKIRVNALSGTGGAIAKLSILIVHFGATQVLPVDASAIFPTWFVPPPASVPRRRLGTPKEGYTIAPSQLP